MKGKIYKNKISPQKSISRKTFFFGNSATGHLTGKFFSRYTPSGLKTVALPGAESIAVQTFLDIIL
jgi:hypothetical protein